MDQVLGGMRGMKGLFYDISRLNSQTGITFRGITKKKKNLNIFFVNII